MITTKNGDMGFSSTITQTDIPKDDIVFELLGTADELSSFLGLAKVFADDKNKSEFEELQRDIISVCAYVAGGEPVDFHYLMSGLDAKTAELDSNFDFDGNFVLYGADKFCAYTDVARAVARRAERVAVGYCRKYSKDHGIITFFNRMSDYLFLIARQCNRK